MENEKRKLIAIARNGLKAQVAHKTLSYSSYGTLIDRWAVFVDFLVAREYSLNIDSIDRETVIKFGKSLNNATPAYAQNLVSAVNTVMTVVHVGAWRSVSPTRECEIPLRIHIRTVAPTGLNNHEFRQVMVQLDNAGLARGRLVAEAARYFGLRAKEASLLNYQDALKAALSNQLIKIRFGTKGGRPRTLAITNPEDQLKVLKAGSDIQGGHFSIIPEDVTWKIFRNGELKNTCLFLKQHGISNIRELRAVYACIRYRNLTGFFAPVLGGHLTGERDKKARNVIAEELGHSRIDITNSYIGKTYA